MILTTIRRDREPCGIHSEVRSIENAHTSKQSINYFLLTGHPAIWQTYYFVTFSVPDPMILYTIIPVDHRWEQEGKVRQDLSYTTNLVQIKGSSKFCNIAWRMGSSGIRTPTCLLFAYLVEEPCLMHCLGNCLVAGKIKVYCR